jgi:deoxyadenosine/deoxycytidine kinase
MLDLKKPSDPVTIQEITADAWTLCGKEEETTWVLNEKKQTKKERESATVISVVAQKYWKKIHWSIKVQIYFLINKHQKMKS